MFNILQSEKNFVKRFTKYPDRKLLIVGLSDILFKQAVIQMMGADNWKTIINATLFNLAIKRGIKRAATFRTQEDYFLGGKEGGVILGKKVSFSYLNGVKIKENVLPEIKDEDEYFVKNFF